MTWNLILEEIPYMLAAMLAAPIVLVVGAIIIGKADRPLRSSSIFVLGAVIFDLLFAALILGLYHLAGIDDTSDTLSAWIDVILGALFLIIGIKAVFSHPSEEQRSAQRARVEKIAAAKAGGLLLAGVLVQLINADALAVFGAGLKEIATSNPYPEAVTILIVVVVFLVVMLVPYWLPTGMYLVSKDKAGGWMRTMSAWLLDHSQGLEIGVGLGFGVLFLSKGLTVLY